MEHGPIIYSLNDDLPLQMMAMAYLGTNGSLLVTTKSTYEHLAMRNPQMFQLVPNCPKKVRTFGGVPASQNFHDFPFLPRWNEFGDLWAQDAHVAKGMMALKRSEAMMITKTFVMLSRWAMVEVMVMLLLVAMLFVHFLLFLASKQHREKTFCYLLISSSFWQTKQLNDSTTVHFEWTF